MLALLALIEHEIEDTDKVLAKTQAPADRTRNLILQVHNAGLGWVKNRINEGQVPDKKG